MEKMLRVGAVLIFCALPWPVAAQGPHANSNAIGFSYSLPEDWEVLKPNPAAPQPQPKVPANAPVEVKKGIACVEIPLMAEHGMPRSSVVVVVLPFDCYGETMQQADLPGFGAGVLDGLKITFAFSSPVETTYELAGHRMWMERVKAAPRRTPAPEFTLETVCTLLKKGAVCWMVEAADTEGLEAFEKSPVWLEGAEARWLVPSGTFSKTPVQPAK